jgi:5'-nucleotidase
LAAAALWEGRAMSRTNHRILIVNDDGIHAEGIRLLESVARRFTDDIWVVAPDEEKSGASHSISMRSRARRPTARCWRSTS